MNKTAITILIAAACTLGYVARETVDAPASVAQEPVSLTPQEEGGNFPTPESVVWMSEAEAKASGKTVLYFVTRTKGCVPCKRLKAMLANPISAEAMNRFACVLIEDQSPNHPWMRHYRLTTVPTMLFVGPKAKPFAQTGAPDSVPGLLQFLQQMEDRFSGKPAPQVIPDATKTSITFPAKPTLTPASHDTAAPSRTKGRSSGKQEWSCVRSQAARGRCYRSAPGVIGQWTFRPGMGGRR